VKRSSILIAAVLTVSCGLACPALAQVSTPEAKAPYEELNRQIYGVEKWPDKAVYEETTTKLRELIGERIREALLRSDDPDSVVQAIAGVQGEFVLDAELTNAPFAEAFRHFSAPGLAVAFVVLRGGIAIPNTLPVLQFYAKTTGGWALKAEADADFHGCSFFVSSLDSPVAGQSWWLAWGQMIGDTGARRKVRLYSFDGEAVKALWMRDNLEAGKVSVGKDRTTVVIQYFREEGTPERPRPQSRIREEWSVTPKGLEQISSTIVGSAADTSPE
jgi:hypothetical protein